MLLMRVYDLALASYFGLMRLISPFHAKAAKMVRGRKNLIDHLRERRDPLRRYIWIHASSLGEFEQGRPIIEGLKKEHPDLGICLTFFSPSGYEIRHSYPLADIVTYLPFDTSSQVTEFVKLLSPTMAIFVKYDFWLHTLDALSDQRIPTLLISALFRSSQIFFKPYGSLFRQRLGSFEHIFVQDSQSAELLRSIGITEVSVVGDTRMDRVRSVKEKGAVLPIMECIRRQADQQGLYIVVVGSSWEQDERVYLRALESREDIFLVIAPHTLDADRLTRLEKGSSRTLRRYTTLDARSSLDLTTETLVVDTIGLLSTLYRYADIAYVGGGFGAGIHNTAEAAVYGVPVLFGPCHHKFREAQDLLSLGGAFEVRDRDDLEAVVGGLLSDPHRLAKSGRASAEYIRQMSGATEQILVYISGKI